jgi:hypothetical protein
MITASISGIDIRKAILAANLNPNHYNESAIYDAIHHPATQSHMTQKEIAEVALLHRLSR